MASRAPAPGELLLVFSQVFSPAGVAIIFGALPWWSFPLLLLFVHYVMVFRGLLFEGLTSGSARRPKRPALLASRPSRRTPPRGATSSIPLACRSRPRPPASSAAPSRA